jgi:serine protease Do
VPAATPTTAPTATPVPTPTPALIPEEVLKVASKSVVLVKATKPGLARGATISGGTGFVIDNNGTIVTNNHVVTGASSVRVVLPDKSEVPARFIAFAGCDDLAVLRADGAAGLPPLALGDSNAVALASELLAVGFPIPGTELTTTRGILSKQHFSVGIYEDVLQTDAQLNPGNSGGPLLTGANGVVHVVGITTGVSTQAAGVSFAIAMSYARPIIEALSGGANRHWLGVDMEPNTPAYVTKYNVPNKAGLLVFALAGQSPFATIRMQPGDVLTFVENQAVGTERDVCAILRSHKSGDKFLIQWWSGTTAAAKFYTDTVTLP